MEKEHKRVYIIFKFCILLSFAIRALVYLFIYVNENFQYNVRNIRVKQIIINSLLKYY